MGKAQIGVSIEMAHLRFLEYLAHHQGASRADIVRDAVRSYINSKANKINLDKEIEKVEELGEKWENARATLELKYRAERKLEELEHRNREGILFKSTKIRD
ncbi:MAG TPA: hypothetical protein EYO15_02745 [Marine Group III euryarchaeote]|uniref:Ribbon-helix-helix protein, CopG family n=1 Tax=Marine Group III euryarchaeote TaxID=2173149 RepID=A0A7J4D0A2_9ARCH|nr:hypothetical protein [Marine Group III euryarchaeote]